MQSFAWHRLRLAHGVHVAKLRWGPGVIATLPSSKLDGKELRGCKAALRKQFASRPK
jgi:hypothetical protein